MKNLIYVNSHPIQYFAPLYKHMNEQGIDVKVWYCSNPNLDAAVDKQFGVNVKWDVPLLEGYEYKFFKNNSWKPSHFNGFFGLINFRLIKQLFKEPSAIVAVHGWHYFTLFMVLMLGRLKGHKVCIRCDVPLSHEKLKTGFKQKLKNFGLRYLLFPRIDYFLYVGTQNRLFYKSHGVSNDQLISCPYAVDNARFQQKYFNKGVSISEIKSSIGIPKDSKVIMFSAKYIAKKRPLDLLEAFHLLNMPNVWLLMVGEGELRKNMEAFIIENELKNVILTGFVNQSKITEYYSISDVFVMCSSLGENWGLSVNEAMNFNIPVVLSDLTGCSVDLVIEGVNGYIFDTGNIISMKDSIAKVLNGQLTWSTTSENIINNYSYDQMVDNLKVIMD